MAATSPKRRIRSGPVWKQRRAEKASDRAATPNPEAMPRCPIPGCGKPTQAAAGRGHSAFHCRYHVQFRNRHGSAWKGTYTAAQLQPYRRAAEAFLAAQRAAPAVKGALSGLDLAIRFSGFTPTISEVRAGLPEAKAKAVWCRLRDASVPAQRVLVAHLAVSAAVEVDPIRPGGEPGEYRLVQIAKAVHRLASGYHKDYGPYGKSHAYSRSTGRMLRHLGRMIDAECGIVAERHLGEILELKGRLSAGVKP